MAGVAVVLLVLERTGSAALAGATIAAVTLPSIVTGPLLGAWIDLTGRRRAGMVADLLAGAAMLIAIVLVAGRGPDVLLLGIAALGGITWPFSLGGLTSMIPLLGPARLLSAANAVGATSLNLALIVGPALAGGIAALAGPATAVVAEAALALA